MIRCSVRLIETVFHSYRYNNYFLWCWKVICMEEGVLTKSGIVSFRLYVSFIWPMYLKCCWNALCEERTYIWSLCMVIKLKHFGNGLYLLCRVFMVFVWEELLFSVVPSIFSQFRFLICNLCFNQASEETKRIYFIVHHTFYNIILNRYMLT